MQHIELQGLPNHLSFMFIDPNVICGHILVLLHIIALVQAFMFHSFLKLIWVQAFSMFHIYYILFHTACVEYDIVILFSNSAKATPSQVLI